MSFQSKKTPCPYRCTCVLASVPESALGGKFNVQSATQWQTAMARATEGNGRRRLGLWRTRLLRLQLHLVCVVLCCALLLCAAALTTHVLDYAVQATAKAASADTTKAVPLRARRDSIDTAQLYAQRDLLLKEKKQLKAHIKYCEAKRCCDAM